MKRLTVILLIVLGGCKPAQNIVDIAPGPVVVRVIDNMTKEPVAGVIVSCRGVQAASDSTGLVRFVGAPDDPLIITHERYRKYEVPVPYEEKFEVAVDIKDDLMEFSGGMDSFYQHFRDKITYPAAARNSRAQSKLWVEFIVEPDGKSKIVHVHDRSHFFSKEIARVFETMPSGWGKKYTGMTFLMPVTFLIADAAVLVEDFESLAVPRQRVLSEVVVTAHLQ